MYLADIDLKSLKEISRQESFFCFGGGKMLRDLLRVCPIENSIIGIIDNNPRKWGTFLSVREREIPVMSLEQALAKKVLGKRILLTVSYLAGIDIMEQLSDCALLKDVSMHWILPGTYNSLSPVHPLNAPTRSLVTLPGITMERRTVQPLNSLPMDLTVEGISKESP